MGASSSRDKNGICPMLPCFAIEADLTDVSPTSTSLDSDGSRSCRSHRYVPPERLEDLIRQLFHLHDLNGDGFLDVSELIRLNEVIAILHQGSEANCGIIRQKYETVFRQKLDPEGKPVPYGVFRAYTKEVVDSVDRDPEAQEMMLEQFVAEAQSGREAFPDIAAEREHGRVGPAAVHERQGEMQAREFVAARSLPSQPLPQVNNSGISTSEATPRAELGVNRRIWSQPGCFGDAGVATAKWQRATEEKSQIEHLPVWVMCSNATQLGRPVQARRIVPHMPQAMVVKQPV
mmetsp:Transcript_50743/g.147765  ORF Transcript_50743/g.147765 Transcript_50743/m.147765 type:complete len:290 (-) Transcript_50743:189-1058(-)